MSQPPDVGIRSASPSDEAGIDAVIRAPFGATGPDHGDQVGDLWADVRAGEHLLAERVAVVDGTVVGHVGISHCWIDARRELVAACMLSPLSTSPDHQERGIGTALVGATTRPACATRTWPRSRPRSDWPEPLSQANRCSIG